MAKLTEKEVKKLQVPEGKKDVLMFDDKLPGFGVRKFASGKASYFVKYSVGDQQRRKALGPFVPGMLDAVRKVANDILLKAHAGVDVVAERKRAAQEERKAAQVKTLGDLVPVYLKVREFGDEYWSKLRPKSIVETSRYLTKAWLPLHGEPVDQITRKMVKAGGTSSSPPAAQSQPIRRMRRSARCSRGPSTESMSAAPNPTASIKALKQTKRTRVLSEAELVDIWLSCGGDFGRIVKLLMLTGQRRQEIGGLEWSEIHAGRWQIELPAARCKNKRPHIIPLSEPALALLQGLPTGAKYVFGFTSWHPSKVRLDKAIAERRGTPLPPWTIHDIRRSVVTHIAELGFAQPHVIEAIVNHVSGSKAGVAGVYNRATYLPEKREVLEQWGRYLTGLPMRSTEPSGSVEPLTVA